MPVAGGAPQTLFDGFHYGEALIDGTSTFREPSVGSGQLYLGDSDFLSRLPKQPPLVRFP